MKKISIIFGCLMAASAFVSCQKDNGTVVNTEAVVTVKEDAGKNCYFQLDDNTVVIPENLSANPFGKEVRAYTLYADKGETEPNGATAGKYRRAQVAVLDSILTKQTAPNLGKEQNDLVYGCDPIDIYRSWISVVEDGYVTLHFCARWGRTGIPVVHTINLVRDTDSSDPFTFELRHNYNGDPAQAGYFRDGLVAFNIRDILAKESRSTYDITLKYVGELGDKEVVFHYTPGTSCALGSSSNGSVQGAYFE